MYRRRAACGRATIGRVAAGARFDSNKRKTALKAADRRTSPMRSRVRSRAALSIAVAATWLAATAALADEGSAENGADVFKKCRACHEIGPNAKNKVGPQLNGIIGRKASSVEGFAYSDASHAAAAGGLVWTEETLFKYLYDPRAFMPRTKMAFAGLRDEQDRKDLIAYLKQAGK
jgi:cytochrome c